MTSRLRTHLARALLLLPWPAALACGGDTIVLGAHMPEPYHFGKPAILRELSVAARTDNPSLTADLLEIYFTAGPNPGTGPTDVWSATRSRRDRAFAAPKAVDEVNLPGVETSPIVSADGLTLWFASDRPQGHGDLDIWVCTRKSRAAAWSSPANVDVLNTDAKDLPRPPGAHERVMPLASDYEEPGYYQIYLASRAHASAPFDAPAHLAELSFPDQSTVDGFLTDDGLTLFYVTGPEFGPADLYVASRRAIADRFERPVALTDLNTDADERDPWLSRDGSQFFFSSDRSGRYEIYVASARREPVPLLDP